MIADIAKKYLGKTEKPNNTGFNDSTFEAKMKAVGFTSGQAWCAYFAELVAIEAIPSKKVEFSKLFSASAVTTFKNFKEAKYTISDTPILDSVVVWQTQKDGVPHWTGHVGIVSQVDSKLNFKSIEGNTSDAGSREGYIVAEKSRSVKKVSNGLQVLGFIKLK